MKPPAALLPGAASKVTHNVAGGMVHDFARAVRHSAGWVLKHLMTMWVNTPDPHLQGGGSPTQWLSERLSWAVAIVMLASVFVAAFRLAITRRLEHGAELATSLARTAVVSVGSLFFIDAAIGASDGFTHWVLDSTTVDPANVIAFGAFNGEQILIIILGLVVIVAQLLQFCLLLVRNAMIVLLAGTLPLASAASNTATGKQWWSKSAAWLLAFVLYKPAAAIVYAAGFRMIGNDQSATTVLSGVFLLVLAVFTLPALMRFLVPATAAMASGNTGAVAGALVGGTLASGAVLATGAGTAAMGLMGLARHGGGAITGGPTGAATGGGGGLGGLAGGRRATGAGGFMAGRGVFRMGSDAAGGAVGGHEGEATT